jgi:NADPH:quinone reductase-like Zn-dependent oxidoreductase
VNSLKPNKDLDYMNELFEAGQIKAVIDGPYELSSAIEAIQYFGEGNHKGKVIITMENEP